MIPDNMDDFIFKSIFDSYKEGKDANFWIISKNYAEKIGDKNMENIYRRIKKRIKKYCSIGILNKKQNGSNQNIYEMNDGLIAFGRHKFSDGYKLCLIIKI